MNTFKKIVQLYDDYTLLKFEFNDHHRECGEILAAIRERIEADKAQDAARLDELRERGRASDRSEALRRLSELEVRKLESRVYTATPAEQEAFSESIGAAETALRELASLQRQIRATLDEAAGELAQLRAATLGDSTVELAGRWLESNKKAFSILCKEVQP